MSPNYPPTNRPRVFISYSHDNRAQCDRVLAFAQQLRFDGIVAELDQFHEDALVHWPRWCEEQMRPENSDFILCVCTGEYKRRVEGRVPADEGKGVFWEGTLIYNYLYDTKGNGRCVPVLIGESSSSNIPAVLNGFNRYHLDTFGLDDPRSDYARLYRLLTRQGGVERTELGRITRLPLLHGAERQTDFVQLKEDRRSEIKFAGDLLHELLDSQFERLLLELDPKGLVGAARSGPYPAEESARQVERLLKLMYQQGPVSVMALHEAILSIRSPFSPFDGATFTNWIGHAQGHWQVANSKIVGVGSDPLIFSDPEIPINLQRASLLTWQGLRFRDGRVTANVWIPLVGRGSSGGCFFRKVRDSSAIICLVRQAQTDDCLALEIWRREGDRLKLLKATPCPPDLLRTGWCELTCQVDRNAVLASTSSDSCPAEVSAVCDVSDLPAEGAGHFGLVKFGGAAMTLADLTLTVRARSNLHSK